MTLSAHQPYFLPYLGYWQLIHAADRFLLADDYAFIRHGWVNRNRILVRGRVQYFRVELSDGSINRYISGTTLLPVDVPKKLRTLEMAYHKAPCFAQGYALAERILNCPERRLSLFLEHSIREVCAYLGITTPIGRTSDLPGNCLLRREERIYDFCQRLGADTYLNAPGGQALYHFDEFAARGLRLRFLQSSLPSYPQGGSSFVPGLSILDAVMFNPPDALHAMLDDYTLIDG